MSYQFSTPKLIALTTPGDSGGGNTIVAPSGIPKEIKTGALKDSGIIQFGYNILFTGAVSLAVIFIILGGIAMITSGGDSVKLAAARKRLMFAIIGLVVVIAAFVIVSIAIRLLGVEADVFFLK